jgi:hypothetical protein
MTAFAEDVKFWITILNGIQVDLGERGGKGFAAHFLLRNGRRR